MYICELVLVGGSNFLQLGLNAQKNRKKANQEKIKGIQTVLQRYNLHFFDGTLCNLIAGGGH